MEILDITLSELEEPLKKFNLVIVSQKLKKNIKNLLKLENIYKLREKDNNNTCTYKNEECTICLKNKFQVLYCNLSVCKICFYMIEEKNRKKCVI